MPQTWHTTLCALVADGQSPAGPCIARGTPFVRIGNSFRYPGMLLAPKFKGYQVSLSLSLPVGDKHLVPSAIVGLLRCSYTRQLARTWRLPWADRPMWTGPLLRFAISSTPSDKITRE
jgi:hypothetical protein